MVGITNSVSSVPKDQAADDDPADRLARFRAGAGARASGIAPSTIAAVVIRIGRSRKRRGLDNRLEFFHALGAQLVGELDDQDAVLGDQADQHHQADLAVHVQRAAVPVAALSHITSSAPVMASGTVNMMTSGPTKLSNCAASTR